MSSSFPLFLPPMSERVRLWPIPPRVRSGSQSPDKSAILDDDGALWLVAVAPCGDAAVRARRAGGKAATTDSVTRAVADTTRTFRISNPPHFACLTSPPVRLDP